MQTSRRPALAALAVTLAVAALAGCSGGGAVTDVDVEEAATLLEDPDVTVVDVRTPAEFAEGHLDGAVNIDLSDPAFADLVAELPQDGAYLVYCRTDNRSGTATDLMAEEGLTDVHDLDGGVVAWAEAGMPLVVG
ncbi:rhodanese-like domain-containing protein [Cellulomonas oligotrophica]|uniref:Sulfurtransferase n=1 Tax=Cellulomonas oligotrophica TaxID=931536 RepID=A0A7Y9FFF3_9CELL|nr:rhodanese-like domain-containing protein [Cellulomonas oligotrophica]NYD86158.1 rhodanese-related sulfurtransferase [Cellulomonas oligotrophica]GIG34330.1 sulfurtransferase [Cellulomonas oligotrophica]